MRRTARLAIHRTNAVRSSSPRIAPGREAGAAGAISSRIDAGVSASIGAGTDTGTAGDRGCSPSAEHAGECRSLPPR